LTDGAVPVTPGAYVLSIQPYCQPTTLLQWNAHMQ
jgi:hypothetical protein